VDSIGKISFLQFNEVVPDWNAQGTTAPKEMILITQSLKELQLVMTDYVGIVRTNVRLERAMKRLDLLHEETEELYETTYVSPQLCELRNLITVGYLIVKEAQLRHESRGLHFNTDYPYKNEIVQNIVL
jgi:L-aspartate oxidase